MYVAKYIYIYFAVLNVLLEFLSLLWQIFLCGQFFLEVISFSFCSVRITGSCECTYSTWSVLRTLQHFSNDIGSDLQKYCLAHLFTSQPFKDGGSYVYGLAYIGSPTRGSGVCETCTLQLLHLLLSTCHCNDRNLFRVTTSPVSPAFCFKWQKKLFKN